MVSYASTKSSMSLILYKGDAEADGSSVYGEKLLARFLLRIPCFWRLHSSSRRNLRNRAETVEKGCRKHNQSSKPETETAIVAFVLYFF